MFFRSVFLPPPYSIRKKITLHPVDGRNAVHFGVQSMDVHTVQYLVQCGCDVNVIDQAGVTALHIAAYEHSKSPRAVAVYDYLAKLPAIKADLLDSQGHTQAAAWYLKET